MPSHKKQLNYNNEVVPLCSLSVCIPGITEIFLLIPWKQSSAARLSIMLNLLLFYRPTLRAFWWSVWRGDADRLLDAFLPQSGDERPEYGVIKTYKLSAGSFSLSRRDKSALFQSSAWKTIPADNGSYASERRRKQWRWGVHQTWRCMHVKWTHMKM